MNRPLIKICNVRHRHEVDALYNQGVDIAGFRILNDQFTNGLTQTKIETISYARSKNLRISVTVDSVDFALLREMLGDLLIDYIFLHVDFSPDLPIAVRAHFSDAKIGRLFSYEALAQTRTFNFHEDADYTLFDWRRGGTGMWPDTNLLERFEQSAFKQRGIVAGGLNYINIGRLLEIVTPFAIDLDSSVRNIESRNIDERKVAQFVDAVRRPSKGVSRHSTAQQVSLPFVRASQWPWSVISDQLLTDNDVVANARLLSVLDNADRYRGARIESVSQRIDKALASLARHPSVERRWLDAALVAFSSTLYPPTEMLNSALRYLHMCVMRELSAHKAGPNGFHLFSNDPGGLLEDYFRINEIHGRLDQDKHARIKGVEDLGRSLIDLCHTSTSQRESAIQQIRMIFDRPVWVLLADQSLSGHSLIGDLEKILWLQQRRFEITGSSGILLVACQIMTASALAALKSIPVIKSAMHHKTLIIESAIFLGDEYSITSWPSIQIKDDDILRNLQHLCTWFAAEFVEDDVRFSRMRRKSGDNLEFGYRKAGLLLARQENCPTDSIPILWYAGKGRSGLIYQGPFPRVHSRIDEQKVENTGDLWQEIQAKQTTEEALQNMLSVSKAS